MNKWLIPLTLCVFATCSVVFAQTDDESVSVQKKPEFQFNMGVTVGLNSFESYSGQRKGYQKVGLYPQFSYGKWRFGLGFSFEFDGNFRLRDLDNDGRADTWTTFSDYFYKLQFVEYGKREEPIYGFIGEFDGYTLGRGLLMEDFSNTLFHPYIPGCGLRFDFDGKAVSFPYIGVQSVVNDVLDWDVIGARLYVNPLGGPREAAMRGLQLGATAVVDIDPKQEYSSKDTRPPRDNPSGETVSTVGFDVLIPLIRGERMDLDTSVEWAIITGKGNGISLGADYRYDWITLHGQLRYLGKQFVSHYFDPFYWVERPVKYDSLDILDRSYFEYLAGADFDILGVVTLSFSWEDGLIDGVDPRIRTGIMLGGEALEKVGLHLTYDKKGIDSARDFIELNNSIFEVLFEYRVTDFARIVFIQAQSFAPTGKSVPKTIVETRFRF
jgi:hypothetical protein